MYLSIACQQMCCRSITSEEQKLFHRKLVIIEQLLEQGKSLFTWKMAETQDFIEQASQLVLNDLYFNLDRVKSSLKQMVDIFDLWSHGNLDIFHSRSTDKSYTMKQLMHEQQYDDTLSFLFFPSFPLFSPLLEPSIQLSEKSSLSVETVENYSSFFAQKREF